MSAPKNIAYPRISIITPSFNQGRFLEETILSVINQSYPDLDFIIIDGGSTDNSVEIIKKYQKHLSYWVSEKDSGQSQAINKGLLKAKGDIVTWLNSDDCYEPGALKTIADVFSGNENAGLVHGKTIVFGELMKERIVGSDKDFARFEYLSSMKIPQPSSFFKKAALDKVGPLTENLHYAMDFELVMKVILLGYKVIRLDRILSKYRMHETSKSNEDLKFLPDWGQSVYNLFYSVPGGEEFALEFKNLGICNLKEPVLYTNNSDFTKVELKLIFLKHLALHYHYHYRFFNERECRAISNHFKKNYPDFYEQQAIRKFDRRLKFIPRFIFRFIKKLRR